MLKTFLATTISLSAIACAPPSMDPFQPRDPNYLPHFSPHTKPQKKAVPETEDPEIQPSDSDEIKALKIAAAKTFAVGFGSARKYYQYQEKWRGPGAMDNDLKYLRYLIANPSEAERFTAPSFWRAALDAYQELNQNFIHSLGHQNLDLGLGMMRGLKIVHATGTHQCWSSQSIGYTCSVDNRMYTDCAQAIQKLKETNCCKHKYFDGVSNLFIPGGCI